MIDNEWHMTRYPSFRVTKISGPCQHSAAAFASLAIGQRVGLGWQSGVREWKPAARDAAADFAGCFY